MNSIGASLWKRLSDEKLRRLWLSAMVSVCLLFTSIYFLSFRAPDNFPINTIVSVEAKAGLNDITRELYSSKIIRSPFWFRILVIATAGEGGVMAGDYFFDTPLSVFGIAKRLTEGDSGLTPVKITFPEGMTVNQMGMILEEKLVGFSAEKFTVIAKADEGYLFPDTYNFVKNATPETVVKTMKNNFDQKLKTLEAEIKNLDKSAGDVVVMASILEAEARTTETRRTIAGILWKRLALGMPLQVDAPFEYVIGKNTFQLTLEDLKYDSPYNTYKYKGLPPTAINNPGLDSLASAVTPIESSYLFYLSDIRGGMHYAKTYAEHLVNKERYLK